MDFNSLNEHCLSFPHTEETFPFDNDTLVYKVAGKMFALTSLSEWEAGRGAVNLKCDPNKAIELREQYEAVEPGFHMNKTHWNTVHLYKDVKDKLAKQLIGHSYELIWNSLPKKIRESLT